MREAKGFGIAMDAKCRYVREGRVAKKVEPTSFMLTKIGKGFGCQPYAGRRYSGSQ